MKRGTSGQLGEGSCVKACATSGHLISHPFHLIPEKLRILDDRRGERFGVSYRIGSPPLICSVPAKVWQKGQASRLLPCCSADFAKMSVCESAAQQAENGQTCPFCHSCEHPTLLGLRHLPADFPDEAERRRHAGHEGTLGWRHFCVIGI